MVFEMIAEFSKPECGVAKEKTRKKESLQGSTYLR